MTAYWTVLGGERERKLATHALESARTHVRAGYAKSVRTRLIPDLRFAQRKRAGDDVFDAGVVGGNEGTNEHPPAVGRKREAGGLDVDSADHTAFSLSSARLSSNQEREKARLDSAPWFWLR